MSDLKLPSGGLTILHNNPKVHKDGPSKEIPQIIQLNIVENVTKDILKSIRNNEQVRLKLGKKPTVQYGRKQLNLSHTTDTFSSALFSGPLNGSEPVYFSGKLSHTLEIQRAKQDTAKSDGALANLENTLKSMKEHQASQEASFMFSNQESKKKEIKTMSLNSRDRLMGTTTPSSPFLGASPRLGPALNSLLSQGPSKEKIRQEAMKIPIIHLLAMNPMTAKAIAQKLNTTQSDCDKVLERVARPGDGGNKELKDKYFRDLDVWKFPYQAEEDRKAAIKSAIHAYDRLRIDKNDPIWQLLLSKEERGKGTVLSRLNFTPQPPPTATPRIGIEGEGKADASDKETKPKKAKGPAEPKETAHKKKPSTEVMMKKKVERVPGKAVAPASKAETKFKSSERIEDSDEEAESVEVVPAKPKLLKARERALPVASSPRIPSNKPVVNQHRSKLSNSSTSSNDLDRSRIREDRTKLKPRPKTQRSPAASGVSPRARTDTSPQKPSPLGSSPPANSTDLENSSKASTQSSAPSSPPSSTDMPLSQTRKNYSPVITGKGRNGQGQIKRKSEKNDEPPAKRQQIHGLGLSRNVTQKLQEPLSERRSSDSSLSSPEKTVPTKESVLEQTLAFRDYYVKYKELHDRLHSQNPDDRSDKELDQLWTWHTRLEKIKSNLWSDWEKAGGEV